MTDAVGSMLKIWLRARAAAADLVSDCRGLAATEFAIIVPLMITMFFGTVELSSGIAVDRKVTLVARTMSDLASQSISVYDTDLPNFTQMGKAILTPYSATPLKFTITELWVDPATLKARVQWSIGSTPYGTPGTVITIPSALAVANTYLIMSEVSYQYKASVPYFSGAGGIPLSDKTYTRPRQSQCVLYNTATGSCPKS